MEHHRRSAASELHNEPSLSLYGCDRGDSPGELAPRDHARLKSLISYVDEKTGQMREVQLVLPAEANIHESRISILTPMGAALYGLAAGSCIDWPDLEGKKRPIRVLKVKQPQELN